MAKSATARVAAPEVKAETPDWYELLEEAVKAPGKLAEAYRFFKQYSLTNRWLAAMQLHKLGLPLMPISTFGTKDKETGKGKTGWLGANRNVIKGEHAAISLVMPVPVKGTKTDKLTGEEKREVIFNRFILKRAWFHLAQTEGEEYVAPEVVASEWTLPMALEILEVVEEPWRFGSVCDTRLGAAAGRRIAISPLNTHQLTCKLVQLARVVLGHTEEGRKGVTEDLKHREVEANIVAYLVSATLGLEPDGMDELRGALQANLDGASRIPDKVAQHAFGAADKIINAGRC